MPKVTTPNGDELDVTSPVALAYYRREPGYTVDEPADGERTAEPGQPLPEVPDDAYPPDAQPLEPPAVDDVDEQ